MFITDNVRVQSSQLIATVQHGVKHCLLKALGIVPSADFVCVIASTVYVTLYVNERRTYCLLG